MNPTNTMKQITVGKCQFELYWFTGKVLSVMKNLETRVHGGGGGGQGSGYSAPVSSTTTVHDQLFLAAKDGAERAFQLQDFDVACRESNQVTVLWAMKAGMGTGKYVLVYNQTTQDVCFKDANIGELVAPSKLGCFGIVLVALVLPFLILVGGFVLTLGAAISGSALWLAMPFFLLTVVIITFFAAIFGPVVWYAVTANKRVRQFKAAINVQELASA